MLQAASKKLIFFKNKGTLVYTDFQIRYKILNILVFNIFSYKYLDLKNLCTLNSHFHSTGYIYF